MHWKKVRRPARQCCQQPILDCPRQTDRKQVQKQRKLFRRQLVLPLRVDFIPGQLHQLPETHIPRVTVHIEDRVQNFEFASNHLRWHVSNILEKILEGSSANSFDVEGVEIVRGGNVGMNTKVALGSGSRLGHGGPFCGKGNVVEDRPSPVDLRVVFRLGIGVLEKEGSGDGVGSRGGSIR